MGLWIEKRLLLQNVKLSGSFYVNEFLMEVKENLLGAYENQDYPLDELIANLGLQGESSRNPLFDTVFTSNILDNPKEPGDRQQEPVEETVADNAAENQEKSTEPSPYDPGIKFAKFDLYFMVTDLGGIIDVLVRYSTQLFKPSTIEKIKKHYLEILAQVVGGFSVKLKDITLSHDFITSTSTVLKDDSGDFNF